MNRKYNINGKQMVFSFSGFNRIFTTYQRAHKMKVGELEEFLSEKLGVSIDTVHNWHCKKNGPIDDKQVKNIAAALEISDFMLLLTETDGGNSMTQLTDRQKDAAKRLYDKCLWFLNEFNKTDGFTSFWHKPENNGSKNPEHDSYELVENTMAPILLLLDQEYFDLHGHPIYDDLCEFINGNLYEIFDGKLSHAYRFEADANNNPTTAEDYDKAMIALNTIVDKYI